ncbi:hypothetical protein Pan44_26570 [Caulifigura coniformis]|uniref:Uncharacterized protein n=1 Tax=Caulifigura coniformis TaxID=2527983 RepID=A0A517SEQ4_9PLAN|nr:hypothetical protein [Caulifigura coniformis]QDT54622.1 hypothetical protein Pan44_26570 [Caulifigura coniformis]
MTPLSERVGTLWQLRDACLQGRVEAWIDACVVAAKLVGDQYSNPELNWSDALYDLRRLAQERQQRATNGLPFEQDPEWFRERQDAALVAFYEDVDAAIEEWESQFDEAVVVAQDS